MWSEVVGPSSSGSSGVDQTGVENALKAVFADTIVGSGLLDASSTGVQASSGAFVQVGGTIPTGTKKIKIHSTIGIVLDFRLGANAGAAASASNLFYMGRGESYFDVPNGFTAGDKLWVRSVNSETAAAEFLAVTYMG